MCDVSYEPILSRRPLCLSLELIRFLAIDVGLYWVVI